MSKQFGEESTSLREEQSTGTSLIDMETKVPV